MNDESTEERGLVRENEALRQDVGVFESDATASKSLTRALLKSLPQQLFLKDLNSVYLVANERYARSLGHTVEELLGKDDLTLRGRELAGKSRAADLAVLQSGRVQLSEESEAHEGGLRWVRTTRIPVKSDAGEVIALLGLLEDSTARRDAERALAASEVQYRRLFEAAKDGILILEADTGRIIDVNPFLEGLTGYSREELLGKHLWEIGAFGDIAASKASFAELQSKAYVRYEDLPLRSRDGRQVDVEFVSNVYRADNQDVIQCNVRDITARKRNERRVREQRAILDGLLESADFEIFSLDRKYCYTAFNGRHAARMKALYGTEIQLGGRQDRYLTAPQEWEHARQRLDRALRGEVLTASTSSGPEAPSSYAFETTCLPIRAAGEIIGVSVFIRDVTTSRRAEEELRFRNLILSTQQETSLDGIAVFDAKNDLVSINRRCAELWGIPSAAAHFSPLLPEVMAQLKEPERFADIVWRLKTTPGSRSQDELGLKDGRTFSSYSAPMITRADGRLHGRVWYFTDITERRRTETENERAQEQLRTSQNLEAVGGLAGGIAHDFNNLLSVILSYTRFAIDGLGEGSPLKDDLLEARSAAERAVALTRQLLAFSRKQVLQPVQLNLNEIVAGLAQMLRRILGHDAELVQVLAPDLGLTLADPEQLEQVVMNLVANARDAMQGQGKVTIQTSNIDVQGKSERHAGLEPGKYVMLKVTDTGAGMDAQIKARLFEPFFTTKAVGKGPGLGLSTVYGIVKQSGGSVQVQSEPGRGASFQIFLPREAPAFLPAPLPSPTGTETILVVEDEEALRKVAVRILTAAGYRVLTARNGREALATSSNHKGEIALLVTDVVMPGMGGSALSRTLCQTRPKLRVLFMSGFVDSAIVHHGMLEPGTNFLAKPFTSLDLARRVRDVLDIATPPPRPSNTVIS